MKWLYGAVVGAVLLAGLSWGAPGVTVIFRRGAAADWTAANPTLQNGEPGYETDTGLVKVGTGMNTWNTLPYSSAFKGYTGHNFPTNTTGGYSGLAINSVCAGRFCTYSTMHQACAQTDEVHINTVLDALHSNYSSATQHICLAPVNIDPGGGISNTTTLRLPTAFTAGDYPVFNGTGNVFASPGAKVEASWFATTLDYGLTMSKALAAIRSGGGRVHMHLTPTTTATTAINATALNHGVIIEGDGASFDGEQINPRLIFNHTSSWLAVSS